MALLLTDRQVVAAAAVERLVNIVSVPGSGKTTVAAARFGYLHSRKRGDLRGVLGLSFNRTAVAEFSSKVSARWGYQMTQMPNLITTFDDLYVRLLHRLLANGMIKWPGERSTVTAIDEYRAYRGYRFLTAGSYQRRAKCDPAGLVRSYSVRVTAEGYGIGGVDDHRAVLATGMVTHEDVRSILRSSLDLSVISEFVKVWLRANFRQVIIDEIYDADELDLWLAQSSALAGTGVTVVGDPWQALYEWRGATPDKVQSNLLDPLPFREYDQPQSFRFKSPQMISLSSRLRAGQPVSVPPITSDLVDVVLARRWAQLWKVGDNVLPLAFRAIGNANDAMLNLLLDEVTRAHLGRPAYGKQTALVYLRLTADMEDDKRSLILRPVLRALVEGVPAAQILEMLRDAALELGANRRPNRLADKPQLMREAELNLLRKRLKQSDVIPGLSIHQAKGCEWERVGVVLTEADESVLLNGLTYLEPEHRVLYVALTRAESLCGALGGTEELPFDSDGDD